MVIEWEGPIECFRCGALEGNGVVFIGSTYEEKDVYEIWYCEECYEEIMSEYS